MSIVLSNLTMRFDGKLVLNHLCATLPDQGVVAVSGPSGAGKTTLLNILLGLQTPSEGSVQGLNDYTFTAVFQDDRLLDNMSVRKNLRLTCPGVSDAVLASHLAELGLQGELNTRVRLLSGGMKRRVALLRAVMTPGNALALDEPFKGLDDAAKQAAGQYILRRAGDRLIILITHDAAEAAMLGATHHIQLQGSDVTCPQKSKCPSSSPT